MHQATTEQFGVKSARKHVWWNGRKSNDNQSQI